MAYRERWRFVDIEQPRGLGTAHSAKHLEASSMRLQLGGATREPGIQRFADREVRGERPIAVGPTVRPTTRFGR